MALRNGRVRKAHTLPYRLPLVTRLSEYIGKLPPGDQLIVGVLSALFAFSCMFGLYSFERLFLVEQPGYGGSLTEGVVGSPRFINPLLAITDTDKDLTALTYAGLMGLDGKGGYVPVLAQSYTVSPDGKTYTFVLRPGAKFSDGTPVTADDVVFTVHKAQDPALKSPELANWANVRVEAVDARTVRFTLPKAYGPFLADTTLGILPSHLWKNVKDEEFPFSPLMTAPVGAGAFQLVSAGHRKDGTITSLRLVAFGGYAPGRAYLNGMTFKFYDDQETLVTAVKNHAVESAYGVAAPNVRTAPYSRVFGVFYNPDHYAPFKQPEVRKALSIAVDRDHIVNDVLGGYATPLMGPVPPGSGIDEPTLPAGDRIATAKAILQNAGWTFASSTGTWSNKKLKLTLSSIALSTSNVPELKAVASEVVNDWAALGVPATLQIEDPSTLTSAVIRPRTYDALYFGMVVGRGSDLFAFWDTAERGEQGLNIAQYSDKSVDALLEKARSETDATAARADLQNVSDAIAADYPAAFTYAPDFLYILPKDVQGVSLPQITEPSERFATVATWYRRSEWVWPLFARQK